MTDNTPKKTWTDAARKRLDDYLSAAVKASGLEPEEAAEVREDLRRHVEEEVCALPAPVVSVEVLEPVLERMGGNVERTAAPPPGKAEPSGQLMRVARGAGYGALWTFGVVLPIGVLIFEAISGWCASVFFDPLRTWWHMVLVAGVPAVNIWLLRSLRGNTAGHLRGKAFAGGMAMAVAGFYAWLFLPLFPLSVMALMAFGMGLLSLTPVFACLATLRLSVMARNALGGGRVWKPMWWRGVLAGGLLLLALEGGPLFTRIGLMRTMSEDAETAEAGIRQLRFHHSRDALLRACYEGNRGTTMSTDISGWLIKSWTIPSLMLGGAPVGGIRSETARTTFYRVTGRPFHSMRPPRGPRSGGFMGTRGNRSMEDFEFDDHVGDDEVAVRVKGVSMADSRLDAHIDGASGLAYTEWTMVFRNRSALQREARFQIQLPPEGVVSRVSLWIDGEPREAAFGGKAQVRKAYQEVAVRQRRDPLLVTASGPSRVLAQCFPIPPDGGEMKIRLGITAPVDARGRVRIPMILERNFSLKKDLQHAVWIQSDRAFTWGDPGLPSAAEGSGHALQVMVPASGGLGVDFARLADPGPADAVFCEDPFAAPEEKFLVRGWRAKDREPLNGCVVVVDGSATLRPMRGMLADVLEKAAGQGEFKLLLARDDGVRTLDPAALRNAAFQGGQNNVDALLQALRELRGKQNAAIVWIHGPQPVDLGGRAALEQFFERSVSPPLLYSAPLSPGGNRVLEHLFTFRAVRMAPVWNGREEELAEFLASLFNGKAGREPEWRRVADPAETGDARRVGDQLARHWAARKIREEFARQEPDPKRVALAVRYQLVTAFSGAVVLETAAQYKRHGLDPVDPSSVPKIPAVPEPGAGILLLAGLAALLLRRRR